jgi:hypothetical protein
VTGSVNAPVPAFADPLPSITEPAQSTVTDLENVAISQLLRLSIPNAGSRFPTIIVQHSTFNTQYSIFNIRQSALTRFTSSYPSP